MNKRKLNENENENENENNKKEKLNEEKDINLNKRKLENSNENDNKDDNNKDERSINDTLTDLNQFLNKKMKVIKETNEEIKTIDFEIRQFEEQKMLLSLDPNASSDPEHGIKLAKINIRIMNLYIEKIIIDIILK